MIEHSGGPLCLGVALIAGFASFLPYIGPAINWIVLGLVTYFQVSNPFGFSPLTYTIVTIIIALVIDQVFDNLVAPRVMANRLKVHPAFVLIAAIIAANLIGLLGIIIAAPLLATLQLVGRYTMRKLLDKDPWPPEEEMRSSPSMQKVAAQSRAKHGENDWARKSDPIKNRTTEHQRQCETQINRLYDGCFIKEVRIMRVSKRRINMPKTDT